MAVARASPFIGRPNIFLSIKQITRPNPNVCGCQTREYSQRNLSTAGNRKNAATIAHSAFEASSGAQNKVVDSPMSRLSTTSLLRSIMIVSSTSAILNPDRNPILGRVLRALVYNQFCAGTDPAEVRKTVAEIKNIGYAGVILGYGREIVLSGNATQVATHAQEDTVEDPHVSAWLQGNLDTLDLIGEGDYMNIKFTGAGKAVSQALIEGKPPPAQMALAMDAIVTKAISQNSRVWVDAEQQIFHPTIDNWALDLMRKYNHDNQAWVLNTIQAYLVTSRQNVLTHLTTAQKGRFTLGIKLVRGAYIQQDERSRIWATKPETDTNYNTIAHDLLSKSFTPFTPESFPNTHLFLAGHNKTSIDLASTHIQTLSHDGATLNPVGFGQLHGMADDLGCDLINLYRRRRAEVDAAIATGTLSPVAAQRMMQSAPRVYKCLNWGSVRDCMHFLMRRAVENASATDRLKDGVDKAKTELWGRWTRWFRAALNNQ